MTRNGRPKFRSNKPVTASDVGKYLRQLANLYRDPHLGNPPLSEALSRIATVLIDAKSISPEAAISRGLEQDDFGFDEDYEFEDLSLSKTRNLVENGNLSKNSLIIIGSERLGITRSRLEKLARDEITKIVLAAVQHEESLEIISEEAKRRGISRSS